ncbi:O-antigen ligase [Colwellia sp. BRX8-9]|uniref:O-antigen ligase family protein n=1 Tax=Colwellia sp. BRX8-9 TaxID=2759831 RepID=UPI0015F75AF6|nr:O-antigen ligase family protein [Colwellia sp. BRX8-9]MBA6349474.1 O-antigen ligase family protein [Colwellia sp. BRX8-9]
MNLNDRAFIWSSFLWGLLLFIPISIRLGELSGKPLDFVFSDFFPLIFIVLCGVYRSKCFSIYSIYLPLIAISYYLGIALIAAITDGGSLSNMASAVRFSKQFLLIPCGAIFFHIYGWAGLRYFSYSILFILLSLTLSDVFLGSFPRGCGYEGRWGGCLILNEVYGFPNSSASYVVLLSLTLIVFYKLGELSKLLLLVGLLSSFILALLSLSRASWVFFALGVFFFLLFNASYYKKILISIVTIIILIGLSFTDIFTLFEAQIFRGVVNKMSYYAEGHEITSGRVGIWSETLTLIFQKPIFGYGFDYFSSYVSGYDTPHQQYLELLFKSGMFGALIYIFCIYLLFYTIKKISIAYNYHIHWLILWVVIFPLLINALFQPIFSYSLVGNAFMFILGVLLEAHQKTPTYIRDVK